MQFNVVSVHEELEPIYEECDPAHLELILTQSLPLLERHWFETMHCLKGSDNAAMLDVSEQVVAEVSSSGPSLFIAFFLFFCCSPTAQDSNKIFSSRLEAVFVVKIVSC